MPNDWELEHRLDPLDSRDTKLDSDGDGLSNLGELRFRTDPRDPDSDGDGISDGQELAGNSDPLDINDQPIPVPVLRVGAASIAFTVEEGDAASPPRVFWITNSGSGGLSWLASSNRPWLHVEPPAGNAPAEVIVTALPGDLGPGTYSGQVTFTAGGALDSPQILRVTLRVEPRPIEPLLGFIRGDSNASGAVDIADPVHALNYLFAEGAKPPCLDAADANDDGRVNIADPVYVLSHLFASGPVIPPPFPACGPDPTADRTSCEVPRACE